MELKKNQSFNLYTVKKQTIIKTLTKIGQPNAYLIRQWLSLYHTNLLIISMLQKWIFCEKISCGRNRRRRRSPNRPTPTKRRRPWSRVVWCEALLFPVFNLSSILGNFLSEVFGSPPLGPSTNIKAPLPLLTSIWAVRWDTFRRWIGTFRALLRRRVRRLCVIDLGKIKKYFS